MNPSFSFLFPLKLSAFYYDVKFYVSSLSVAYFSGTRLVVSVRGDEPYEELEILKDIDATMLLHELPITEDKISRVHAARR